MMEHKITIMKYQLMFPRMTKKLFDEKERIYQITVICIRLDELQTKGAVLQKMGKPTKNGTKMTFAPVQSAGEYEAEMQRIMEDGKKLGMKFEDKEEEYQCLRSLENSILLEKSMSLRRICSMRETQSH